MTKDELEKKKIELEIEKLELPFWKNPAYLTILATIIIGFSSYYIATDKEKKKQIEDLTMKNELLNKEQNTLEKTQVDLKADHFQRISEDLKYKNEEVEKNIQSKELKLILLENSLTESKKEFANFQVKLNDQQREYDKTKSDYENYKSRVSSVIEKVSDYGPKYANELIKSSEGQHKIESILSVNDKSTLKKEIENFAFEISNKAFDQGTAAKRLSLNIQ